MAKRNREHAVEEKRRIKREKKQAAAAARKFPDPEPIFPAERPADVEGDGLCAQAAEGAAKRSAARALRRAASTSRSFGSAVVTRLSTSRRVTSVTSSTARAKASSFACDGFVKPLILRTYWTAASRTSSSVADGS